jgi:Protein of unknown function (DUF2852)
MYSTTTTAQTGPRSGVRSGGFRSALRRADAWLDDRGTWAWVALTVLSFILFWPIGLALLAYMIWGKRMFSRSCGMGRHDHSHATRFASRHWGPAASATGNRAFDNYKAEALSQLEEEQAAFEAFLERLRTSKDKTEFDAFMEDRARATAEHDAAPDDTSKPEAGATTGAKPARPGEY